MILTPSSKRFYFMVHKPIRHEGRWMDTVPWQSWWSTGSHAVTFIHWRTFHALYLRIQKKTFHITFILYHLSFCTGQQVVEEILDAQRPACPPEYFNIQIPKYHSYHTNKPYHSEIPVLRTRYDMRTGFSPNNPRQQVWWMLLCNLLTLAGSDAKYVVVIPPFN